MTAATVAFVVGSENDLPHLEGGFAALKEFGVPFEVRVLSAHRTPDAAHEFSAGAAARGVRVIVAAAGGAAHLAGAMAANSILPVIGVPIPSTPLNGFDALLSTVMMPPGIPVAAVAVGKMGGTNAALLAVAILALADAGLREKLLQYRRDMAAKVLGHDRDVQARFAR